MSAPIPVRGPRDNREDDPVSERRPVELRPAGIAGFAYELGLREIPRDEIERRYRYPQSGWLNFRHGRLHYVNECEAASPSHTVVLLHGFSASVHTWDGVSALLRQSCRFIRLDLPPFGLTGALPSVEGRAQRVDLEVLREALDTVLDALALERVTVVGNSLGGLLAWDLAVRRPTVVERLVLVDAAGFPMHLPAAIKLLDNPVARWLSPRLQPAAAIRAAVRDCYGDASRVTTATYRRYTDLTFAAGTRAAIVSMVPGLDLSAIDTRPLSALQVPTLVLWGAKDRWIPPSHGRQFAKAIPGARLVMFETLGHIPMEEDPASVAQALLAFLNEPTLP
ncbi:Pimeloyl-ACP methyl ester carboxylesterase [Pararobbsia alpina]|uniref:alpha/beta fold hydrolase n=1 Tax=Pararobbsia alpina TaxID=621374 RepID=UPI0039A742D2